MHNIKLKIQENNIPTELKDRNTWVCWRYELKSGRTAKVPYDPKNGLRADITNQVTWADYNTALASIEASGGIGFVFSRDDDVVGIDIDKCLDEKGNPSAEANEIIKMMNSYTEISPSGKGVHILALSKSSLPDGRRRNGNVEIYDTKRYFTITGNHMPGTPKAINERTTELIQVYEAFMQNKIPRLKSIGSTSVGSIPVDQARHPEIFRQLLMVNRGGASKDDAQMFGQFLADRYNTKGRRVIPLQEIEQMVDFVFEKLDRNNFHTPRLWDAAGIPWWPRESLEWLADGLIPKGGIGFLSGAPKDGKSLLALDLAIHLAHGKDWLKHYRVRTTKTLYIAREDPQRRIRERIIEINSSYEYPSLPSSMLHFMFRDRFDLMNDLCIDWLTQQVEEQGFEFLILDVLNRMIPGLDELSAKDMAKMVDRLEKLNRDLKLTILCVDHTRKPPVVKTERDNRQPNPFDLKGSIAKYGCADFMLCLSRTNDSRRLQLYCENKDNDERPHFFINISPKDSGKPKFSYLSSVKELVDSRKEIGDKNQTSIYNTLCESIPKSRKDLQKVLNLKDSTIRKHLAHLQEDGKVRTTGKGKNTVYFRSATATSDKSTTEL